VWSVYADTGRSARALSRAQPLLHSLTSACRSYHGHARDALLRHPQYQQQRVALQSTLVRPMVLVPRVRQDRIHHLASDNHTGPLTGHLRPDQLPHAPHYAQLDLIHHGHLSLIGLHLVFSDRLLALCPQQLAQNRAPSPTTSTIWRSRR